MSDLLGSAAPDFNDPLGLLRACHERIRQQCDTLERLADHIDANGVDAEARKSMALVHRYFKTAGKHHHEDEEKDVFPYLARQSLKIAQLVHDLRRDHAQMDERWAELEPLLAQPTTITDPAAFRARVEPFIAIYRDHIQRENDELLEYARHIFSSDQLKKMGKAMADRRGVRWP